MTLMSVQYIALLQGWKDPFNPLLPFFQITLWCCVSVFYGSVVLGKQALS